MVLLWMMQIRNYRKIFNDYDQGISKLIIVVTGKGLHSKNQNDPYVSKDFGILKYSVPEYIKSNNELMSVINEIKDADIKDGVRSFLYF